MVYKPYSDFELSQIIVDTREVSDRPFMLFTAYAISCLCELADNDDEDDVPFSPNSLWGKTLPKKSVDRLLTDCIEDFKAAADSGSPLSVFGRQYTIRHRNAFDRKRLCDLFSFKLQGDSYLIERDGIMDLATPTLSSFKNARAEIRTNREYFRKIVYLADGTDDGWDKLTDMEVAYYCWGVYYNKSQCDNYIEWIKLYQKYFVIGFNEVFKGWTELCQGMRGTNGMYSFSADNIRKWNAENGQVSVVDSVDSKQADDFWYSVAVKKRFA